jgi:hypothetical protein
MHSYTRGVFRRAWRSYPSRLGDNLLRRRASCGRMAKGPTTFSASRRAAPKGAHCETRAAKCNSNPCTAVGGGPCLSLHACRKDVSCRRGEQLEPGWRACAKRRIVGRHGRYIAWAGFGYRAWATCLLVCVNKGSKNRLLFPLRLCFCLLNCACIVRRERRRRCQYDVAKGKGRSANCLSRRLRCAIWGL